MTSTSTPTGRGAWRAPALTTAVALLLATQAILLAVRPVSADVTFTVTHVGDNGDITLADNVCDANSAAGRQCTLRAAIQQANASAANDAIAFNIAGDGVKTILPNSPLPAISRPLTIDGYTQPGSSVNTAASGTNAVVRIALDGSTAGIDAVGLIVSAPHSTIRGLAIGRFDGRGIRIDDDATGARIVGCFIGTDAGGTLPRGNRFGVIVRGDNAVIGNGTKAGRNLILSNGDDGVTFVAGARGARVQGNLIGTAKTGNGDLGNVESGIELFDATNTTIGGASPDEANIIRFNGDYGVLAFTGTRNRILRNSIYANGGPGIDLGFDGPTPNDLGDADAGPNNLQNYPVLESAATSGGTTVVEGSLDSAPSVTYLFRFYSNPDAGDEGLVYRGQLSLTTAGSGSRGFTFTSTTAIPVGHTVTATATDPNGNTSEFAAPALV